MNTQTTAEIILAITPLVSLVITALVKKFAPRIPGYLLPVIAAVVGIAPDYVNSLATGATASPLTAALLGLAATGLHQIKVQLTPAPKPLDI